jgi:hypothetical protein
MSFPFPSADYQYMEMKMISRSYKLFNTFLTGEWGRIPLVLMFVLVLMLLLLIVDEAVVSVCYVAVV